MLTSTHRIKYLLALAGLLVLLLYLIGPWADAGPSSEAATRSESAGAEHGKTDASKRNDANEIEPRTRRTRSEANPEGPGELRLSIVRKNGGPVSGSVYWTTSEAAPSTADQLLPALLPADPGQNRKEKQHAGQTRLEIPAGHWTWLRASGGQKNGRPLAAFARLAPFSGSKSLELILDESKRSLHVFLLESDLGGPAALRDVKLFVTDMKLGGPARLLRTAKTDRFGYARFAGLEPGAFLLCAPGTRPTDPPPGTARLILPEHLSVLEYPVQLVIPEKTRNVTLKLSIQMDRQLSPPPKIFLKRLGGRPGQMYPIEGFLFKGKHTRYVRVPAGTYELGVLPTGVMLLPSVALHLEVPPDKDPVFSLVLSEQKLLTELELLGIPKTNFPLIIHARSASETCDEQPNMLFMGSYKWHTPSQKVPVLPSPVWIVASGHTSCWMSKAPMRIVGGQVIASMVPATQIQISRLAGSSKIADEAWVEVGFASYKQLIPLRSSLIMRNGRTFAASNGRAVVPRGKFTVKALGKSGEPLWSRSLTADKPFQSVELEN